MEIKKNTLMNFRSPNFFSQNKYERKWRLIIFRLLSPFISKERKGGRRENPLLIFPSLSNLKKGNDGEDGEIYRFGRGLYVSTNVWEDDFNLFQRKYEKGIDLESCSKGSAFICIPKLLRRIL